MPPIELLALNGAPGSGKNTITHVVCDRLIEAKVATAVIDADEIALVFLHDGRPFEWKKAFMWRNLAALWPNYAAIGNDLKVIVPLVIDDDENLEAFKAATPNAKRVICELTAPVDVLKERVATREPDNQERMFALIDRYEQRRQSSGGNYADFEVSTHNRTVEEVATEVISKAGWQLPV